MHSSSGNQAKGFLPSYQLWLKVIVKVRAEIASKKKVGKCFYDELFTMVVFHVS